MHDNLVIICDMEHNLWNSRICLHLDPAPQLCIID